MSKEVITYAVKRNYLGLVNDGGLVYEMANLDLDGMVFAGGTGNVAFFKN